MFDAPPDFFSLIIAIAALIFARKAYVDAKRLRARLDAIEGATAPVAGAAPPPVGTAASTAASDASAAPPPPPPPPAAPADPGFEERIGTRWVVWIGGL